MSTTVSYKGSTLATVSNNTKTLLTEGKYLEDDITITDSTPTLGTKSISSNGTYTASSDSLGGYSQVSVSVPNTYSASDEGKVVDNGALVSQTTATYNTNNTYDTTKIKTVTVAVPSGSPNLQAKTNINPSTSSQTIQADTGYDGLSSVQINAMPTQTLPTSASSSGSGSSKNTQVAQSTSRISSTTMSAISNMSITVAETGTYDIYYSAFRSSTSDTWSTQIYIAGSAYGSAQSTWSNHIQNVHLTNVSLTKNQTVQLYGIARGSNYYLYGGTLTIVQQ